MNDEGFYRRWDELSSLVEKAEGLSGSQLESFYAEHCGDDTELASLLRTLLSTSSDSDQKIRDSIAQVAGEATHQKSLIGTNVGAYTLIDELGVGGMGTVYLATRADGEFDKKVAVKVVNRSLPSSASAVMFRNERQALANLHHPSIPTLVDSGELEDGRPYFICDFIDGPTLDDYCFKQPLSKDQVLDLFEGLAQAVKHAHTNFILHLDIKPANVLVQHDGTPSLLDFGVARAMGDDSDENRAFSPNYASPEQIRGERLSAASDVYSLGALLYRLLADEPPFAVEHKAPTETVFAKRAEFVERLQRSTQLDDIDADLRAFVRKAMADKPSDRFTTVESLLSDLNRYRKMLPVKARRGGAVYRIGKYVRRSRYMVAFGLVAILAYTGFTLREVDLRKQAQVATVQAQTSARIASREADTSRRVSAFLVNVFESMDPGETRGDSLTARELLDRAAARVDEDLIDQPSVGASIKHTMGKAYIGLGLFDDALLQLERALALSESTGNTSSLDHAEILYSLGKHYDAVARHQDALAALTAGLDIQKSIFGPTHIQNVGSLMALARLNRILSNYETSEALMNEASAIVNSNAGVSHALQRELQIQSSRLYSDTGRKSQALEATKRAVEIGRAHETDPLQFALTLNRLGSDYMLLGQYEKALVPLHEAFSVVEGVVEPSHPKLADLHLTISAVYLYLENFDAAEQSILKGIAIQEVGLGDSHPALAMSVGLLGEILYERGSYADAEAPAKRALEIMRSVHPEEHANVNLERYSLARLYHKLSRQEEAERLIDEANTHYAAVDPAANRTVLDARLLKADILADRGQVGEAKSIYAEVFTICEGLKNLQEHEIQTYAKRYAEFLVSQGESVDVDELKLRLSVRVD